MDANVQELTAMAEKLNIDSGTPKYSTNWREAIEGMWAATGRAYYNPKIDTNWCHLPMEMRSECIKWMDFETRMRMRRTSKTEKSLVESAKKMQVYRLRLCFRDYDLCMRVQTIDKDEKLTEIIRLWTTGDHRDTLKRVSLILKFCDVQIFDFMFNSAKDSDSELVCKVLSATAPFRFKTFRTNCESFNWQLTHFFLKHCEGLENFQTYFDSYQGVHLDRYINLPSFDNANVYLHGMLYEMESTYELVQKWIDNDAKIGTLLCFYRENFLRNETKELFAEKFKDRVISRNDSEIRIRTDNASKHIILSFCRPPYDLPYAVEGEADTFYYYSCHIIASDLLEFKDDGKWFIESDKWIDDSWYAPSF